MNKVIFLFSFFICSFFIEVPIECITTSTLSDIPAGWVVYKDSAFNCEVAHPSGYNVVKTPGLNKEDHPELDARVDIFGNDSDYYLSIDMINTDKYKDISSYVKSIFKDKLYPIEYASWGKKDIIVYKLDGGEYYYTFIKHNRHIYQLCSPSHELLLYTIPTFRFLN